MKAPAVVSLQACESYDRVLSRVEAALAPFGGMEGIVRPGDRASIKINLLNDSPPERAVVTHPSILVTWMYGLKTRVDPDRCQACGACLKSCPAGAITMHMKAVIDPRRCIECLCCMELCPHDAVYEAAPATVRVLRRIKGLLYDRRFEGPSP